MIARVSTDLHLPVRAATSTGPTGLLLSGSMSLGSPAHWPVGSLARWGSKLQLLIDR